MKKFSTLVLLSCLLYLNSTQGRTDLNNRIVGGDIARDGEFPFTVSIRINGTHDCGGAIISERHILTAAHCVKDKPKNEMTVVAGTNTLDRGGYIYLVDSYDCHEKYYHKTITENVYTLKNDIAIITLTSIINFNKRVQSIDLNTDPVPPGSDLVIGGWGKEINGVEEFPNDMKVLWVKALSNDECIARLKGPYVEEFNLCGFKADEEGVCKGDSGSPLVYNGKVAGIVSWMMYCATGVPDVYIRVSYYTDWINKHMNNVE